MKGPTKEAVASALAVLIQSINDENGFSVEPHQRSRQGFDVTLDELELAVKAIQMAHKTLDIDAAAWATHLRTRRNHQTPIGRLPTELMAHIILSAFRYNDRSNVERMQELASVCTMWWRTIINFQAFWTTFNNSRPSTIALKVKRSGSLPLSICIRNRDPFAGFHPSPLEAIDQTRLKSLACSGTALQSLAPAIRKLSRQLVVLDLGQRKSSTSPQVKISAREHLRHVKLRSVTVHWSALRNLKTLSITRVSQRDAPSLFILLQICDRCPMLEKLELFRIYEYQETNNNLEFTHEPAILPRLRSLELVQVPARLSLVLVSYVRAERLELFKLREHPRRLPLNLPDETALSHPQYATFVASVSENTAIDRATVVVDRSVLSFTAYTKEERVGVQLINDNRNFDLVNVVDNLIPPTVDQVTLRFHFHIPGDTDRDMRITMPLLKDAIDVSLKASHTTSRDLLTLLSTPQDLSRVHSIGNSADAANNVAWIAPKLARLRIDLHGFTDEEVEDIKKKSAELKHARSLRTGGVSRAIFLVNQFNRPIHAGLDLELS